VSIGARADAALGGRFFEQDSQQPLAESDYLAALGDALSQVELVDELLVGDSRVRPNCVGAEGLMTLMQRLTPRRLWIGRGICRANGLTRRLRLDDDGQLIWWSEYEA